MAGAAGSWTRKEGSRVALRARAEFPRDVPYIERRPDRRGENGLAQFGSMLIARHTLAGARRRDPGPRTRADLFNSSSTSGCSQ